MFYQNVYYRICPFKALELLPKKGPFDLDTWLGRFPAILLAKYSQAFHQPVLYIISLPCFRYVCKEVSSYCLC